MVKRPGSKALMLAAVAVAAVVGLMGAVQALGQQPSVHFSPAPSQHTDVIPPCPGCGGGGGCGSAVTWGADSGAQAVQDTWHANTIYYGFSVGDAYLAGCAPFEGSISADVQSAASWWFSPLTVGYLFESVICVSIWAGSSQIWSGSVWQGVASGQGAPQGCSTSTAPAYGGNNVAGESDIVILHSWSPITNDVSVHYTEVSWYQTTLDCAAGTSVCYEAQSSSLSLVVPLLG